MRVNGLNRMMMINYNSKVPFRLDNFMMPWDYTFEKGTPLDLIRWKYIYLLAYRRSFGLEISYGFNNKKFNHVKNTQEVWDNVGVMFGGGKESLFALSTLREIYGDERVFAMIIGFGFENRELIKRLKKMGMKDRNILSGEMINDRSRKNRTWCQFIGIIPWCYKYKIGKVFHGTEINYVVYDKTRQKATKFITTSPPLDMIGHKACRSLGYPISFNSLSYPVSAWNTMKVLHEHFPEYAKYQYSFFDDWREKKYPEKAWRVMLYAESLGITLEPEQKDIVNNNWDYYDVLTKNIGVTGRFSLCALHEAQNSLFRLKFEHPSAIERPWVETPNTGWKKYLDPDIRNDVWSLFETYCERKPSKIVEIDKGIGFYDDWWNKIFGSLSSLTIKKQAPKKRKIRNRKITNMKKSRLYKSKNIYKKKFSRSK